MPLFFFVFWEKRTRFVLFHFFPILHRHLLMKICIFYGWYRPLFSASCFMIWEILMLIIHRNCLIWVLMSKNDSSCLHMTIFQFTSSACGTILSHFSASYLFSFIILHETRTSTRNWSPIIRPCLLDFCVFQFYD